MVPRRAVAIICEQQHQRQHQHRKRGATATTAPEPAFSGGRRRVPIDIRPVHGDGGGAPELRSERAQGLGQAAGGGVPAREAVLAPGAAARVGDTEGEEAEEEK